MEHDTHPYRSVLYMPGSRPRALEKARSLPADALILDLEDAVAPAEKPGRASSLPRRCGRGYGGARLLVRVNGRDTESGADDFGRGCAAGPDAILLPKVEWAADMARSGAARRHGAPGRGRSGR